MTSPISLDLVKSIIAVSFLGEGPMIHRVAKRLNISARTLQRRLHEGGTSYTKLVDEVRLRKACRMLDNFELSIAHIAAKLGFADPGSFSRSFFSLSGIQPRAYRHLRERQKKSGNHQAEGFKNFNNALHKTLE